MAETEGLKQRPVAETEKPAEAEPALEGEKKKKKKKKKTQDHEVCAGTGTLDQIFIVFLFMTVALLGAMYYLFSRKKFKFQNDPHFDEGGEFDQGED